MNMLRAWTGLALLALILFGTLGYAAVQLVTGHLFLAAALIVAVWVGGGSLAWVVAWLVMLGAPCPTGADVSTRAR